MESKEQTFTSFVTELSCFSFLCSNDSDVTQRLKYTNKILLPESVLYSLHQNEENNELEFPLFFKVYNKALFISTGQNGRLARLTLRLSEQ